MSQSLAKRGDVCAQSASCNGYCYGYSATEIGYLWHFRNSWNATVKNVASTVILWSCSYYSRSWIIQCEIRIYHGSVLSLHVGNWEYPHQLPLLLWNAPSSLTIQSLLIDDPPCRKLPPCPGKALLEVVSSSSDHLLIKSASLLLPHQVIPLLVISSLPIGCSNA
jgi:hypothetical protein